MFDGDNDNNIDYYECKVRMTEKQISYEVYCCITINKQFIYCLDCHESFRFPRKERRSSKNNERL